MKQLILTIAIILFSTLTLWGQTGASRSPAPKLELTAAHRQHRNKQHNRQHRERHHSGISARR